MKSMAGLIENVRFLEIETLSETGCIFSNGEIYGGLMGPSGSAVKQRRVIRRGFTALGEALRDRAEALWRERSGGST
jgi:hypothetical protein